MCAVGAFPISTCCRFSQLVRCWQQLWLHRNPWYNEGISVVEVWCAKRGFVLWFLFLFIRCLIWVKRSMISFSKRFKSPRWDTINLHGVTTTSSKYITVVKALITHFLHLLFSVIATSYGYFLFFLFLECLYFNQLQRNLVPIVCRVSFRQIQNSAIIKVDMRLVLEQHYCSSCILFLLQTHQSRQEDLI